MLQRPDSGFPTVNLLPGPGVDVPERVERGPGIERVMSRAPRGRRGGCRGSRSRPSRNRATAASLAAFRAAPAVPPRRITSKPRSRQGNVSRSGGSKCSANGRVQVEPRARARRRGRDRSGRTGSAAACRAARAGRSRCRRRTRPSSGRRSRDGSTTSICSGSSSNSQRASITSSALFISVAESIVIFGPICQVGCLRASSGVTSASSAADLPRNGPPDDVRMTRRTSWRPPGLERLEDRRVLAVDGQDPRAPRAGQLHDQRAGDDERLLVGQGDGLAGLERRPGPVAAPPPRRSRSGPGRSPGPGPSG